MNCYKRLRPRIWMLRKGSFLTRGPSPLELLSDNPRHPGQASHEIDDLSNKYGVKVWQSYLENRRAGARRMFWAYGPDKGAITILGIEKHPNTSQKKAYKRVSLDRMPKKSR